MILWQVIFRSQILQLFLFVSIGFPSLPILYIHYCRCYTILNFSAIRTPNNIFFNATAFGPNQNYYFLGFLCSTKKNIFTNTTLKRLWSG